MIDNFYTLLCESTWKMKLYSLDSLNYILFNLIILFNYNQYIIKIHKHELLKKHIIIQYLDQYKQHYNLYNIDIDIDKFIDILDKVMLIEIDFKNMNDNILSYYLKNDTLAHIKEYYRYYNNKQLINWIYKQFPVKINQGIIETVFDANVKINSFMDIIINMINDKNLNWNNNRNNLFGLQNNNTIYNLVKFEHYLNTKGELQNNLLNNNILFDDINTPHRAFDLIYFDLPHDIHNVIHANCCQKIKKLKLRGTKAEPLLLQFVMMTLNKNGRAIMIVPDSLLFSDSIQPIETRKYLVENYNVKKIIQIDEDFYRIKGVKNSILYFENNGKTTDIEFSKIYLTNNDVKQDILSNININYLQKNLYSLHHKCYVNENINNNITYTKMSELFNIITINNNEYNKTNEVLVIDKYYKNDESIKLIHISDINFNNNQIYIVNKTNDNFSTKYLEYTLKTKYEQLTKGKMKQFDISKIYDIQIPNLSDTKKNAIYNYIMFTNQIISHNIEQINLYKYLKICLFDSFSSDEFTEINNICTITSDNNSNNNHLIGIIKNSLTAGTVYFINPKTELSNNSLYLKLMDKTFNIAYIYQYLKYMEPKLKEMATTTTQPSITKSQLLSLKIPNVNQENQEQLIKFCNDFDNNIIKYESDILNITEKDIISTVIKLNSI